MTTTTYYAGSQRVAQRQAGVVRYFLSDHLGSASVTVSDNGSAVAQQRYFAYGQPRVQGSVQYVNLSTDYRFTGQRSEEAALGGLYDYGGRFYWSAVGRFLSVDSVVPRPGDPQSLNRYSYVRNNPLRLVDPSGNTDCAANDDACWQSELNSLSVSMTYARKARVVTISSPHP